MIRQFPVEWDPSFATGIPSVDEQHQQLIHILNLLAATVETGPTPKQLLDIVAQLADYTRYHFTEEERLMEAMKYPELEEHRLEHQTFINQIELFDLDAILATEGLASEMLHFLKTWLCDHILGIDQRLGESWRCHQAVLSTDS